MQILVLKIKIRPEPVEKRILCWTGYPSAPLRTGGKEGEKVEILANVREFLGIEFG